MSHIKSGNHMGLQFYNTLSKKKEPFIPLVPGKVRMYNCGPTVYNYIHIGNCRAFLLADLLRRYLEYKGYEVTQVMNITDVGHLVSDADEGEDKMEIAARREKKDPWQIAEFYTNAFFEDIDTLNIRRAHYYPRATQHVPEMIEMIQRLLDGGYAYIAQNVVYFDLSKFPRYGQLSGNTLEKLQAGARVEVKSEKRSPYDFALWFADKPGHIMQWDSPWGRGYPGWHIECSAMSRKYLGDQLDIHTGGEDNIFPHHECEIAQSESATGKPFVRYWLHARHLLVDGQKMSKSLGNFYTLRDLIARGYSPRVIRLAILSGHYRMPLNFTLEGLEAAKNSLGRLTDFIQHLKTCSAPADNPQLPDILKRAEAAFEVGLDDDLNISAAMAALFDMVHDVYKIQISSAQALDVMSLMCKMDFVLGLLFPEKVVLEHWRNLSQGIKPPRSLLSDYNPEGAAPLPDEIQRLIEERQSARKARDFKRADEIRKFLLERGIILEDTPQGTRWKKA